jgi:trimeric autotransporter adhesin
MYSINIVWKISLLFAAVAVSCLGQAARSHDTGDGGLATKAAINGPSSIAVDRRGNLFVYELAGEAVRRIDANTGIITTVLKGCNPPWKVPRSAGCIGPVSHLQLDSGDDLLLSEFTYNRLCAFNLQKRKLSVIAGNGDLRSSGDGGPATKAGITVSHCFTLDGQGNLIICDSRGYIRRVEVKTGIISTVAGSGRRGSGGDHGTALDAEFTTLVSVAVDRAGNIFVADDTSHRIRRIDATTGIIDTVMGSGPPTTGSIFPVEFKGEGALATDARVTMPRSLAFDLDGNLLFLTTGRVCRIDHDGHLRTIAGVGREGFSGDHGPATRAQIEPDAIAVDENGNLFIAEYVNNRIRRVDAKSGVITTVGGTGLPYRPPEPIM